MAKKKNAKAPATAKRKSATASPTAKGQGAPARISKDTGFADMSWSDKVVWVCMQVMVALVPIVFTNLTWLNVGGGLPLTYDQFDIPKVFVMRACALVALAAWGAGLLLHGGRLRHNKVFWLVLIVVGWITITTFTSIHWQTSLFGKYRRYEGLVSFLTYAAWFFIAVQIADRPARMRSVARTFFFSSVLVAIYGLMQYQGAYLIDWQQLPFEFNRSFSTFGNPDMLGGFLVLALPVALALALSEPSRWWRLTYWVGFIGLFLDWITAFTRGAWIGGGVALVILVFIAWRAKPEVDPIDWGVALAGSAGAVAVMLRSLQSEHPVLNVWVRVRSIFEFGSGSAKSRFLIWDAALKAIEDRPILGFGPDTFRLVFPKYKSVEYVQSSGFLSVADNVHNYPLQITAGIGIPGFLLLYGLFGWVFWISGKLAFAAGKRGQRLVYAGYWAAAFGYLVHLMFGLSVTGSSVFLWLFAGFLVAPLSRDITLSAPVGNSAAMRTVVALLVAVVALTGFVGNWLYFAADNYYLRGRLGSLDFVQGSALLEEAISLNPFNDMYRAELALKKSGYWQQLATTSRAGGQAITREQIDVVFREAEQEMLRTIDFVPPEYDNYVFLANLYNNAGELVDPQYYRKAISVATRGIDVEPYGPAIRVQAGRAYLASWQFDEAIGQLELAVEMDPSYTQAWVLLAEARLAKDDLAGARTAIEEALEREPNHAIGTSVLKDLEAREASATTAQP